MHNTGSSARKEATASTRVAVECTIKKLNPCSRLNAWSGTTENSSGL